jgi:1,4-dihydroxy-2-naphthoate octaprenyltransferase
MGARLRTLPAAIGPVLVGGGLAWSKGGFAGLPFLAALGGAVLLQVGTNYANDYSDFVRGADTGGRLGAPRVTQTGLMSPASVRTAAAISFGLAVLAGTYLVARGGWPVVWIGLASIAAGVCYTGGPWPFGYHGLGEAFVLIFFGPVAVIGTVYVQMLAWPLDAVSAGVGVGALTTAILVVNNLRDRDTDAVAGKRTLAVRIGVRGTRIEYAVLLGAAAAIPIAGVRFHAWPTATLLSVGALGLTLAPLRVVLSFRDPRELNGALSRTAMAAGLYGLLFATGCLL